MLHERLYLVTDKESYLAGEHIWISCFCYDAVMGKPSLVSAVAYLELQNLSGSVVQAKIALAKGRGSGLIALPVSLPTGNYRLIAYTRYMYSESEQNYFSRIVTVYNPLTSLRSDKVRLASGTGPVAGSRRGRHTGPGDLLRRTTARADSWWVGGPRAPGGDRLGRHLHG